MAAIANYKDNLLQAAGVRFDASLTEVDWTDIVDRYGLRPDNNATLGAEFGKNIAGVAQTYHLAENAVTQYDFAESNTYLPGTETLSVTLNVVPAGGSVVLSMSLYFVSNTNSTTGYCEANLDVLHEGVAIFSGNVCRVPNASGPEPIVLTLSEKVMHTPAAYIESGYLVSTVTGDYLMTESGDYLMTTIVQEDIHGYTFNLTFNATGDGTRGAVLHLAAYALVLKR